MIEQLVSQIAAKVGVPEAMARQGVGVVMGMPQEGGRPRTQSNDLFRQIPGAESLATEYEGAGAKSHGRRGRPDGQAGRHGRRQRGQQDVRARRRSSPPA